jgi:hypothetical protein
MNYKKLLFFGYTSFISWQLTAQNEKQTKIIQHLIASQIYTAEASPSVEAKNLAKHNSSEALKLATDFKDALWQARAHLSLALIDKIGKQYTGAVSHLEEADKYYKQVSSTYKQVRRENDLADVAEAQTNDISYKQDRKFLEKSLRAYDASKKEFPRTDFIVEIFETKILGIYESLWDNKKIEMNTVLDSVRKQGLYAISASPSNKNEILQSVIKWYYSNEIKSPEVHAFELYQREAFNTETYSFEMESTGRKGLKLVSDQDGNFLWEVTTTFPANHVPLTQMPDTAKIAAIYKGLIHPKDKNWAIVYLDDKIHVGYQDGKEFKQVSKEIFSDPNCFLSMSDAKALASTSKNNPTALGFTLLQKLKDAEETTIATPKSHSILLSGKLISLLVTVTYPRNTNKAFEPLNMDELEKGIIDIDWEHLEKIISENSTLNKYEKEPLNKEIENLKLFNYDKSKFLKEFEHFKSIINRLGKDRKIYLSRRGYPGNYLGRAIESLKNNK